MSDVAYNSSIVSLSKENTFEDRLIQREQGIARRKTAIAKKQAALDQYTAFTQKWKQTLHQLDNQNTTILDRSYVKPMDQTTKDNAIDAEVTEEQDDTIDAPWMTEEERKLAYEGKQTTWTDSSNPPSGVTTPANGLVTPASIEDDDEEEVNDDALIGEDLVLPGADTVMETENKDKTSENASNPEEQGIGAEIEFGLGDGFSFGDVW